MTFIESPLLKIITIPARKIPMLAKQMMESKDKKGRNIVREKDINWLLREVPVKSLFDEDDLLFFKYVLVEKAGFNLRHKIAHCLMDYRGYDILNMHLLILVLLRLGRYDFVKQGEKVEEKVADSD